MTEEPKGEITFIGCRSAICEDFDESCGKGEEYISDLQTACPATGCTAAICCTAKTQVTEDLSGVVCGNEESSAICTSVCEASQVLASGSKVCKAPLKCCRVDASTMDIMDQASLENAVDGDSSDTPTQEKSPLQGMIGGLRIASEGEDSSGAEGLARASGDIMKATMMAAESRGIERGSFKSCIGIGVLYPILIPKVTLSISLTPAVVRSL